MQKCEILWCAPFAVGWWVMEGGEGSQVGNGRIREKPSPDPERQFPFEGWLLQLKLHHHQHLQSSSSFSHHHHHPLHHLHRCDLVWQLVQGAGGDQIARIPFQQSVFLIIVTITSNIIIIILIITIVVTIIIIGIIIKWNEINFFSQTSKIWNLVIFRLRAVRIYILRAVRIYQSFSANW